MTSVETPSAQLSEQQLGTLYQYTVEAYKQFEKLAELLPNPIAAQMFKQFAVDEREHRDLIEAKIASTGKQLLRVTLGNDLQFQEMLEGDIRGRGQAEFLIARERTMMRRLNELGTGANPVDRGFLVYVAGGKRAHIVELERELELIRIDPRWWHREDALDRIVHGVTNAE